MTKPAFRLAAMGALALLYSAAPLGQTHAAEGRDNCDQMITSAGAVIARSGTYCLKAPITSAPAYDGAAITIAADNVTIDCNGHVIRDSGTSIGAAAIRASRRENVTVRNCKVVGFYVGIDIDDGSGHLVENNLIASARATGIEVSNSQNSEVRRNQVFNIGGANASNVGASGIRASANVRGNTVANVAASSPDLDVSVGISATGKGNEVRGNVVRGIEGAFGYGIYPEDAGMVISDNHVTGSGSAGFQVNATAAFIGNTASGFSKNYSGTPEQGLDNL